MVHISLLSFLAVANVWKALPQDAPPEQQLLSAAVSGRSPSPGSNTVTISATDSIGQRSSTFVTLTINDVEDAPTIEIRSPLERDVGEEDVEFADRDDLKELVAGILKMLRQLIDSFATGNVLKNGIPVAIIGRPNVGKSTLLNALLNEDKAIVSDIAGTTRDSIEDEVKIGGISFRFIDTAGIRETEDVVENIGIKRTFEMVEKANIILYLIDSIEANESAVNEMIKEISKHIEGKDKQLIVVANKIDKLEEDQNAFRQKFPKDSQLILLSALKKEGIEQLTDLLKEIAADKMQSSNQLVVTNVRHFQALKKAAESLERVQEGLNTNITGDFLAMDIRQSLHYLGEITGTIEIDRDILGHIFSSFCIGK